VSLLLFDVDTQDSPARLYSTEISEKLAIVLILGVLKLISTNTGLLIG
jgi:hypothetical protein